MCIGHCSQWIPDCHAQHIYKILNEILSFPIEARYVWSTAAIGSLSDASGARLVADGLAVRTADGLTGSVELVRALGNGQVPAVAALAWRMLTGSLTQPQEAAMDQAA